MGYDTHPRTVSNEATARPANGEAVDVVGTLRSARAHYPAAPEPGGNGNVGGLGLDPLPFVEGVARRWPWLVMGGFAMALLTVLAGLLFWQTRYTVVAQLMRQEPPLATDVFRPRSLSPFTLASLLGSPEMLDRVGAQIRPRVSTKELAEALRVTPERNSDLVNLAVSGADLPVAIETANIFAREAVRYSREMQAAEAAEVRDQYRQQLARLEQNLARLQQNVRVVPTAPTGQPPVRTPLLAEKLEAARAELVDLLARYTEVHPLVQAQRAKIQAIETQLSKLVPQPSVPGAEDPATSSGASPPVTGLTAELGDQEMILSQLQALEREHLTLSSRLWLVQAFAEKPPGYYRLFAPATPQTALIHGRTWKIAALGFFGATVGVIATLGLILLIEIGDDRLKTAADVRRVTGLPVLASAGDLKHINARRREEWAFRIWTALQHRLSTSPNHGLVCGITSANPGEGRSTWIRLLAEAASQRGFRVLTIATQPSENAASPPAEKSKARLPAPPANESAAASPLALTTNALAAPEEVAARLTQPDSDPLVHIPLPGWVWNLERRKQWQAALNSWRKIDNLVILVELPPASVPEAVLLAENLPNLVWLTASGGATATDTLVRLETLRNARCHLAGAVVNRESGVSLTERFPRWIGRSGWTPDEFQTEED